MLNLKYLEIQRLIRELQFLESDYKYQSEIVRIHENDFLQSIDTIVDKFPDLKELLESKKNIDISKNLSTNDNNLNDRDQINPDPKIKSIYRSIVKITHPDKVKNERLNDLYLEATNSYESGDFLSLYKVSMDLKLEFDWGEEEISKIKKKIEDYKNQISLLKSTYTYKWILSENKNEIILDYLRSNLNYVDANSSAI